LTQLETIDLPLLGTTIYRWRINGRRPVGDLVGAIEDERIVASVQPNYLFTLQEDAAKVPLPGPVSPPLYPAADPNVIAVTATDSGDAIFAMANRGNYIAVAAPGVDILALAPGEALQL